MIYKSNHMDSDKIKISSEALGSAFLLRNNNLQRRHLTETITDIIRRINQELKIAHREGKHFIITTIPITFEIPNMSNKDSQRVIWANIIDELNAKHYRTWICPQKNKCRIKITWMSPDDESEVKHQINLIIKHTKEF